MSKLITTPEGIIALNGAINKWDGISRGAGYDICTDNCPLCKLYHPRHTKNYDNRCEGCPIKQFTGEDYCENSPYAAWDDYHDGTDEGKMSIEGYLFKGRIVFDDISYELSLDELNFLKEVLEAC